MKYSKLDRAMAAANLSSLGVPMTTIKSIAVNWTARQLAQSLNNVSADAANLDVRDELGNGDFDRMFVSFHFSVYPHIYRALAQRSPTRTITSLIGQQTEEHQASLRELARTFGFDILFIQSGPSMVRAMRTAIAEGCPAIILLDIPWSKTKSPPDMRYAVPGGHVLGLSTVARLVKAIDPRFEAVIANREADHVRLARHATPDFKAAYACFGEQIARDPADYERLHQMHEFFEFDRTSAAMISFRVKDQRYGIHARSMRAWKLPADAALDRLEDSADGLCHDDVRLARMSEAAKEPVNVILCL